VLVRVENVKVVPLDGEPYLPSPGGPFRITWPFLAPGPDTILVSNLGDAYSFAPDTGMALDVQGVLRITADGPTLLPRNDADIIERTSDAAGDEGAPASPALRVVGPNPSADVSRVRFALPEGGAILLEVHDLLGRRVQTLAAGTFEAGWHEVGWSGRDGRGERVPPGVYFLSLKTASRALSARIVRTR
jgi:hypothetical protein